MDLDLYGSAAALQRRRTCGCSSQHGAQRPMRTALRLSQARLVVVTARSAGKTTLIERLWPEIPPRATHRAVDDDPGRGRGAAALVAIAFGARRGGKAELLQAIVAALRRASARGPPPCVMSTRRSLPVASLAELRILQHHRGEQALSGGDDGPAAAPATTLARPELDQLRQRSSPPITSRAEREGTHLYTATA